MLQKITFFTIAAAAAFTAQLALAQSVGTTGNVPGGITLVPGTIVTPQVGGSAATGTVPLAGTIGSAGVRNFDPQLAPPAVPSNGSQYRVAPYPGIAPAITSQSTLPQNLQIVPPGTPGVIQNDPSPMQTCPSGAITANGLC